MPYAIIQTPPGSTPRKNKSNCYGIQKASEKLMRSVSFFISGYEVLTEGAGSNSGTCFDKSKN